LSTNIRDNPDWYPYFKNCVGAVDGTHLPVHVSPQDAKPYFNRKGTITQNVLAACDFSLCFTYILAGWEGSVSDSTLWDDARESNFTIPTGKYVLGDAGFALSLTCQTPFRGVRYHLREFSGDNSEYTKLLSSMLLLQIILN
jgi:hypothetical protein